MPRNLLGIVGTVGSIQTGKTWYGRRETRLRVTPTLNSPPDHFLVDVLDSREGFIRKDPHKVGEYTSKITIVFRGRPPEVQVGQEIVAITRYSEKSPYYAIRCKIHSS